MPDVEVLFTDGPLPEVGMWSVPFRAVQGRSGIRGQGVALHSDRFVSETHGSGGLDDGRLHTS